MLFAIYSCCYLIIFIIFTILVLIYSNNNYISLICIFYYIYISFYILSSIIYNIIIYYNKYNIRVINELNLDTNSNIKKNIYDINIYIKKELPFKCSICIFEKTNNCKLYICNHKNFKICDECIKKCICCPICRETKIRKYNIIYKNIIIIKNYMKL